MEKPMTMTMPMVRIRLKCSDVDGFVDRYHADVNMAGIFVRTRSPIGAGTAISFDFRLADDACLFRGRGVVIWARNDDTLAPLLDAGMMLSFDELRDGTRENFEHVLQRKRTMEEAADTVPTLVRTFAGDRPALPMTTKMTASELEVLRARMRDQMAREGAADAPPLELDVAPSLPVLPPTTSTPLAKVLVMPPQPAPPADGIVAVHPDDLTPLPPVARLADFIEDQAPVASRPNLVGRMLRWLSGA